MKKILVLDDELEVDFIFKVMLEDEILDKKLSIEFYSNPQECLNDLISHPEKVYDFIFSDINMPQINGIQFARQLRSGGYRGKIVFMSAYIKEDYEFDMNQLGIDIFFSKPINFKQVRKLLDL